MFMGDLLKAPTQNWTDIKVIAKTPIVNQSKSGINVSSQPRSGNWIKTIETRAAAANSTAKTSRAVY